MDVRLYAVAIEKAQPVESSRNVQFNVLAFIEHFDNLIWATSINVQFVLLLRIGYQHPPFLPHLGPSNVSVNL